MKTHRLEMERAQSAKLRRLGAQGSMKLADKAKKLKKFASGGTVADPMPGVEGSAPKPRLDRPSRGGHAAKGKKGTNVNVVIMQHPPMAPNAGAGPAAGPAMPPAMGAPHPMPPMPAPAPGPIPAPAGGPPMRKHGGSVGKYAKGGKVKAKKADGGEVDDEPVANYLRKQGDRANFLADHGSWKNYPKNVVDRSKSYEAAARMMESDMPGAPDLDDMERNSRLRTKKNGGKVKRAHGGNVIPFESKASKKEKTADEAKDKAMSKPVRARGGKVPHMDAGAGSGMGRLELARSMKKAGK